MQATESPGRSDNTIDIGFERQSLRRVLAIDLLLFRGKGRQDLIMQDLINALAASVGVLGC